MCGIAGYNVSAGFKEAKFGKRTARRTSARALLENESRGKDAAGWAAVGDDGRLRVTKRDIPATNLVRANLLPDAGTTALAVHTRAATTGSPLINENNHPVHWDGVYVTHNGMIHNHFDIKNEFKTEGNKNDIPNVDSVALAMLVKDIMPTPDTNKLEELGKAFEKQIKGSYAFSAFWDNDTSKQLLVRGRTSPLHVAIAQEEGMEFLAYSSENQALTKILKRLGAYDLEIMQGGLTEGFIYLIEDGKLIGKAEFEPAKYTSYRTTRGGHWNGRAWVNHVNDWDDWESDHYSGVNSGASSLNAAADLYRAGVIDDLDTDNFGSMHWTKKDIPRCVYGVEEESKTQWGKIAELKKLGLIDKVPQAVRNACADAEDIVAYLPFKHSSVPGAWGWHHGDARYYVLIGTTELIFEPSGKLLDAINWTDRKSIDEVWAPIAELLNLHDDDDEESDTPKDTKESGVPPVESSSDQDGIAPTAQRSLSSGVTPITNQNDPLAIFPISFRGDKYVDEGQRKALLDHIKNVNVCKNNPHLRFLYDWDCKQHAKRFSQHTNPLDCFETITAARETMTYMRDAFEFEYVWSNMLDNRSWVGGKSDCDHKWNTDRYRMFRRKDEPLQKIPDYSKVPLRTVCEQPDCNASLTLTLPGRRIYEFDPWIEIKTTESN